MKILGMLNPLLGVSIVGLLFATSVGCGHAIDVSTISLHLPMQFDSERSASCENCAQIVVASLTKLADFLGLVSVDALVLFVLDKHWYLESFQTYTITDNDVNLLAAVSRLLHIHPVKYTVNPPNSPAVLAHCRVISYVLNQFPNW